jgi:hypothetical protein
VTPIAMAMTASIEKIAFLIAESSNSSARHERDLRDAPGRSRYDRGHYPLVADKSAMRRRQSVAKCSKLISNR